MAKLPSVSGQDVIAAFARLGFETIRVHGSHHILRKPGHKYLLTVPVHQRESVAKGTLKSLLRAAGVATDQFIEALP